MTTIRALRRPPGLAAFFLGTLFTAAFAPAGAAPGDAAAAPRFETVPGYTVCSLYVNGCDAATLETFSSKVSYSADNGATWLPAFDLVYMPREKAARGTLVKLSEDTAYRVRVELEDDGQRATLEAAFRTRSTDLPVARTIVLGPDTPKPYKIRQSGTPDGYLRFVAAPGFVLDGGEATDEALNLDGAQYVILDGLTIRGGRVNGLVLRRVREIHILNCDIAGYGRVGERRVDLDGKYYVKTADGKDRDVNFDSGIHVRGADGVRIERCYLHDPRNTSNSWYYSHPAGPNAVYLGDAAGVALRYNDFVGSDARRWNDAVEGWNNGFDNGGPRRDAEIVGNYFAFGNDDGMELDGGQENCRFFYNKSEGFFCGVSTAPCMRGPSYLFQNLFAAPGDDIGAIAAALKNVNRNVGWGRVHFLNNTVVGGWSAMYDYGIPADKRTVYADVFKGYSRNNLFSLPRGSLPGGLFHARGDFDHDFFHGTGGHDISVPVEQLRRIHNQERHALVGVPRFAAPEKGFFALTADSPGHGAAVPVPNFLPDAKPNIGAFQPGGPDTLPYRPAPFRLDAERIDFDAGRLDGIPPQTVTVAATGNDKVAFKVMINDATRHFRVTPMSGTVEPGKPLTLTVAADPSGITRARMNSGAFLARTAEGWTRTVAVYADSRRNPGLLARDRADAVYGKPQSAEDGVAAFTVDIPKAGPYYFFARTAGRRVGKVAVSVDGNAAFPWDFRPTQLGSGSQWIAVCGLTYGQPGNRPVQLTAGRHAVKLQPAEKGTAIEGLALAPGHDADMFLLSPFGDVPQP